MLDTKAASRYLQVTPTVLRTLVTLGLISCTKEKQSLVFEEQHIKSLLPIISKLPKSLRTAGLIKELLDEEIV